ncbi:hypothetical protein niasHS_003758 [Heterodera schachtii]|uniref:Proteasome subunit beta type-3 n=1 Tax=Heterodera schachtii TaxID=97005 RepID=A0ABD2KHW4_HETSC
MPNIMGLHGGSMIAMRSKDSVVIACDLRMGEQAMKNIATNATKIHPISDKVFIGLTGFNADATTVLNKLRTHQAIYEMREQRPMSPKVLTSYLAWMLYKRRFGPFLIEPIIVGLQQNEPFISHMDVVGSVSEPEDYTVGGTGGDLAMSLCEALWRPDMTSEEMTVAVGQAMLAVIERDASTGWGVVIHTITAEGGTMYKIVQRKERNADGTAKTDTEPFATPSTSTVVPLVRIAKAPHRKANDTAANVPADSNTSADSLSSAALNTVRTEIAKSGGVPSPAAKQSAKDAGATTDQAQMDASIRLIDDEMELIDAVKDFLIESNTKYSVIGAIGAQGTGKSTILSMLAGNNPVDMYRQYIFRPAAREAVEACRYQTTKVSVYVVPKLRTFFLDCQPLNCAPLLEDFCRARRVKGAEALDAIEVESLHLLLLLYSVCHSVVLCVDWFIDLSIVRRLMRIELFYPILFPQSEARRVNLVVLHQRAKSIDLEPLLVSQRMRMLNAMFETSSFNVNGGLTMAKLGFGIYEHICADLNVNYILLGELKPRTRMDEFEKHVMHQDDYGTVIAKLRHQIYQLPNSRSVFAKKTEAQWFTELAEAWKRIREELPTMTEDGCTFKRQRGIVTPFSRNASNDVFMLKQRTAPQGSEIGRGRQRRRSRRGGTNWEDNTGSILRREAVNFTETATDEAEAVESTANEHLKTAATAETEGQQHQKRRVWRTRNRTALDCKNMTRKQWNIEQKTKEGSSSKHKSVVEWVDREQQLDESGRSGTPDHGDNEEFDQRE